MYACCTRSVPQGNHSKWYPAQHNDQGDIAAAGSGCSGTARSHPEEVAKLDTIAYADLVKAGNEAIAKISGPRRPVHPPCLALHPPLMGLSCCNNPSAPVSAEISKDIPVMIGSTLNEMMPVAYGEKELTLEQAKERLVKYTVTKPTNTFNYLQRPIQITRLRICSPLIRYSGPIPSVPPMPAQRSRAHRSMSISWRGRARLTMPLKVHFTDWTFRWHSTMSI